MKKTPASLPGSPFGSSKAHVGCMVVVVWLVLLFAVWRFWVAIRGEGPDPRDLQGWVGIWVLACGLVACLIGVFAFWRVLPKSAEKSAYAPPAVQKEPSVPKILPKRVPPRAPRPKNSVEIASEAPSWKYRCPSCTRTIHRYARICPHCRTRLR